MAETRGFVHKVKVLDQGSTIASVGPSRSSVEQLVVTVRSSDPASVVAVKISMVDALMAALVARREVLVVHRSSLIQQVQLGEFPS